MVEALLHTAQLLIAGLAAYNLAVAVAGWRHPTAAPVGTRQQTFSVVVPAHNEATVIAGLLADLQNQDYATDLYRVTVLADHCTDETSDMARSHGVAVSERSAGDSGKGPALAWFLAEHPLVERSLVVLDADNRVPADFLSRLSDELDAGHGVIQTYLDVSNPDRSAVATASALSYWASNRMVQLARRNLGWPADLGGTGMCLTSVALAAVGGFGSSLAEDQEMGVNLFRAGIPVTWVHDVRIRDEKPSSARVAARQRGRWAGGRRSVAKNHTLPLLRMRSVAAWDLALRLNQPSRIGMALVAALLAVVSWAGLPLWPWEVWTFLALIQFLAPVPFLIRDDVPARYLIKYPLLVVLPLLKLSGRLTRSRAWYHTPHEGTTRDEMRDER